MRCWGLRKNERIMENEHRTFDAFRGRVKSKQIVLKGCIMCQLYTRNIPGDDVSNTNLEQL
jgi:hypothetical protein